MAENFFFLPPSLPFSLFCMELILFFFYRGLSCFTYFCVTSVILRCCIFYAFFALPIVLVTYVTRCFHIGYNLRRNHAKKNVRVTGDGTLICSLRYRSYQFLFSLNARMNAIINFDKWINYKFVIQWFRISVHKRKWLMLINTRKKKLFYTLCFFLLYIYTVVLISCIMS